MFTRKINSEKWVRTIFVRQITTKIICTGQISNDYLTNK